MRLSDVWLGSKGTPLSNLGEFGLVARLTDLVGTETRRRGLESHYVAVGIGDDAASVRPAAGYETLVTCDTQVDGRHFRSAWISPRQLGERCATVNLSDIAAMGGIPRAAVVSLAIGPDPAVEDIEEIYRGMLASLAEFGAVLIGGNITSLSCGLILDVTMLGEVESGQLVRRNTASAGDLVWVTGLPGSAAAGHELLRKSEAPPVDPLLQQLISAYLSPIPRIREGRALAQSRSVTAMIDLSDGLLGDLRHLVEGSSVGILVREESLPVGEAMARAARVLRTPPRSLLLGPSDDYELLFTTSPERAEEALRRLREASGVAAWPIGEVTATDPGEVVLETSDGRRKRAPRGGWNHFLPGRSETG